MALVLLVSMYFVAKEGAAYVQSDKVVTGHGKEEQFCVVIDAGHGGGTLRQMMGRPFLHYSLYFASPR